MIVGEAVDCLDEADRTDRNQIVELLAAIGEADREVAREIEMRHDQLVAGLRVARLGIAPEQLACRLPVEPLFQSFRRSELGATHGMLTFEGTSSW
jgi:hypothetical protein